MRYLFKRFVIVIFGQLGCFYICIRYNLEGRQFQWEEHGDDVLSRKPQNFVKSPVAYDHACSANHHVSKCWGNCIVDSFVCWICPMHFVKCFVSVLCQCFWFFFGNLLHPQTQNANRFLGNWLHLHLGSQCRNYIPTTPCHWGTVNGGCGFVGRPHKSHPFKVPRPIVYEIVRAISQKMPTNEILANEKSVFSRWGSWLFIPLNENICVGFWRFPKFPIEYTKYDI